MLKLSKKDRRELNSILDQLDEGIAFIKENETLVMRETSMTSNDIFTSKMSGKAYVAIDKEIGSKLAFLLSARSKLARALTIVEVF